MPKFGWHKVRIPVWALLDGLLYTVRTTVVVGTMILFADFLGTNLQGEIWTPEIGLVHLLLGALGGVELMKEAYVDMGFTPQMAQKAAFATVPITLFVIFFVPALYDLWEDEEEMK